MTGEDEPPPIELVEPEHEVHSEQVVGRPGNRPLVVGLGLALVAVIGFVAVTSDRGDGGPDRETSTTLPVADEPEPTSTTAPAEIRPAGVPAPVFGERVGAAVLLGSAERGWRLLDLDSGLFREVPALDGIAPDHLLGVRDAVVVLNDDPYGRLQMVRLPPTDPDGEDAARLRDFWPDLADGRLVLEVLRILPAGIDDRLWVVSRTARPPNDVLATLVDIDGNPLLGPITVPTFPAAATASGLVYDAGGRSYLVGAEGTRDLGVGRVFAAGASTVGRVVCDEGARCVPEVMDLERGVVARGVELPVSAVAQDDLTMVMAGNGALAVVPDALAGPRSFQDPDLPLQVILAGGGGEVPVRAVYAAPAWLPDGSLAVLTGYGLERYQLVGADLGGTRAEGLRPRPTGVDVTPGLVVIPR